MKFRPISSDDLYNALILGTTMACSAPTCMSKCQSRVAQSRRFVENRAALEALVDAVQVIDLDADVAREYGQLRAHLRSIGQPIGPNDLWIAAHALARDVPLITHNLTEFRRVPGLAVETWMTGAG